MTTKFTLLLVVLLGTSSCVTDFIGNPTSKSENKIEITQDNYLYEGDLYKEYLNLETKKNYIQIEALEKLSKTRPLDDQEKKDLDSAYTNLLSLKAEFNDIIDIVGIRIPKPKPPCPNPTNCDFVNLEYLFISDDVMEITMQAYDTKDDLVQIDLGEFSSYPNPDSPARLSSFKIGSYAKGGLLIKVQVLKADETIREYFIDGR